MDEKKISDLEKYNELLIQKTRENIHGINDRTEREKNGIIRETKKMQAEYEKEILEIEKRINKKKRMVSVLEDLSEFAGEEFETDLEDRIYPDNRKKAQTPTGVPSAEADSKIEETCRILTPRAKKLSELTASFENLYSKTR